MYAGSLWPLKFWWGGPYPLGPTITGAKLGRITSVGIVIVAAYKAARRSSSAMFVGMLIDITLVVRRISATLVAMIATMMRMGVTSGTLLATVIPRLVMGLGRERLRRC